MKTMLFAAAAALFATAAFAQPGPGHERMNPDADRDGKVTLAEFKKAQDERQARMFARVDANKDGRITQAELDAMPKRGDGRGHGAGAMLMRLDANNDGAVTRAEMGAMAERRFQMADSNKDGWLSKGEMLTMRQRMRGGPGSE